VGHDCAVAEDHERRPVVLEADETGCVFSLAVSCETHSGAPEHVTEDEVASMRRMTDSALQDP
jgi:hypothetical protein